MRCSCLLGCCSLLRWGQGWGSFFFFFNDTATTEIYTFPTRRSSDLDQCAPALACGFSRGRCAGSTRSEEHTSELQSQSNLVCRLLLEKKTILTYGYRFFVREKLIHFRRWPDAETHELADHALHSLEH